MPDNIDKREGSIIYDALAPAALVMGQQSLDMANVIKETYIKTASGEFLDYRAIEHGTSRYPATQTEAKAKVLNDKKEPLNNVQIGDKFASIGDSPIFYAVTKVNDDLTVELTAELKDQALIVISDRFYLLLPTTCFHGLKLQKLQLLQGM